nr:retrovirus-related Pol polyprotein from transposon TNT 1-94 [Tanacetum cinerariifolium]
MGVRTRTYKAMVITLKWIYKVKLDELGGILKNKARLVARGYRQEEGIDFEEYFAPVARLKFRTRAKTYFFNIICTTVEKQLGFVVSTAV